MKKQHTRRFRELLYKLRTEGDTPGRQAGAVALGVLIGCSPFYGFHLALCLLFARLFRLNRGLTYLAAHVSIPGLWPLLVLGELQLGSLLRGRGRLPIHLADLRHLDVWQYAIDLLLGSAVVGVALAVPLAWLTYRNATNRRRAPAVHDLIESAAYRYLDSGMFDWEFVRGKLRHDPVYLGLLRRGLLPAGGTLLDLGCGRGILPALLAAARQRFAEGLYPEEWPPPPDLEVFGIEGRPKAAAAARRALGVEATIVDGDLRTVPLPTARAVLLLDVLHYLPEADQEALLARIAAALEPGGVLLVREADADAGWRFTATRLQERLAAIGRRQGRQRFRFRGSADWRRLLEEAGFEVSLAPMSEGTPYSNVLLSAHKTGTPLSKKSSERQLLE